MKCTLCAETITNPICPDCLTSRVFSWLNEINPKLAQKVRIFDIEIEEGTRCLFCSKKMNICAHCVSRDVFDFLAEENKEISKEFAARFDFEIRKSLS